MAESHPPCSESSDLNINHVENTTFPATSRLVLDQISVCPGLGKWTLDINRLGLPGTRSGPAPLDLPPCPGCRVRPAHRRLTEPQLAPPSAVPLSPLRPRGLREPAVC